MSTSFDFKNKSQLMAALEAVPDVFEEEFKTGMSLIAEHLVAVTVEETPVGTGESGGNLYATIHADSPVATANGWIVQYGTNVEYAEVIELGRQPGSKMPPVEPLTRWVWLNRSKFSGVEDEDDAKRVAFAIAKKIARDGFASPNTDGWRMFEKALHTESLFVQEAAGAIRERITDRVNAIL